MVEGYTDAVLLHQAGIVNAVATLGTVLTDAHAKLLSTLSDEIVMCFDSDDAGPQGGGSGGRNGPTASNSSEKWP